MPTTHRLHDLLVSVAAVERRELPWVLRKLRNHGSRQHTQRHPSRGSGAGRKRRRAFRRINTVTKRLTIPHVKVQRSDQNTVPNGSRVPGQRSTSKHTMSDRVNNGRFSLLPDELCLRILHYLPASDMCQCMRVCRRWHVLCNDPSLWTQVEVSCR